MVREASRPFEFTACLELREMLGRSAWDERELLTGIEDVPQESIFYHTRSSLLRSRYLAAPYPNDFATWAAIQVRDRVLGERLAAVDPFDYSDLETLRAELITIIDDHLSDLQSVPRIVYGEPFHFMRSTIIEVPSGVRARTLAEFSEGLRRVDLSAAVGAGRGRPPAPGRGGGGGETGRGEAPARGAGAPSQPLHQQPRRA